MEMPQEVITGSEHLTPFHLQATSSMQRAMRYMHHAGALWLVCAWYIQWVTILALSSFV